MNVSVVIPTYQAEPYLWEMLCSISLQTRLPDELIISDDASTDYTEKIVKDFAASVQFSVKFTSHVPAGITANYLNAVRMASGDLVIVADQDDVWLASRIEEIERVFQDKPGVTIVSCDSEIVDESLRSLGTTVRGGTKKSRKLSIKVNSKNYFLEFLKGVPLLAHTLSFRSDIISDLLDKPQLPQDWWFEEWASCIGVCKGRLFLIHKVLTLYRRHPGQQTSSIDQSKPFQLSKQKEASISASKYEYRIATMSYCLSLIQRLHSESLERSPELSSKAESLCGYINFLRSRDALITDPLFFRLGRVLILLVQGKYHKYSKGYASACLDALTHLSA